MDLDELYEICDECASYGDDYDLTRKQANTNQPVNIVG